MKEIIIYEENAEKAFKELPGYMIPYDFCLTKISKIPSNNIGKTRTKIVFTAQYPKNNLVYTNDIFNEIKPSSLAIFEVDTDLDIDEECNNFGDIVYCIEYLLKKCPYETNSILERMPTCLFKNREIVRRIATTIPNDQTLINIVKKIIKEKHKIIEQYENHSKSIMDVYDETFSQ